MAEKPVSFDTWGTENIEEDIANILDKIDALVSVAGNSEQIEKTTASFSSMKTEELKDEGFSDAQLQEIARGVEQNLQTEIYAKKCYNWMQMREIRRGLLEKLDTSLYEDPLYSSNQMQEIRLGLSDHLNISSYAKLMLSATDMRKIRQALFNEVYKKNPKQFGKTIEDIETGITIRITPDCMKAFIMIPKYCTKELTPLFITKLLDEYNISYGIKKESIQKLVYDNTRDAEVCIAEGKTPIDGTPGYYETFFKDYMEQVKIIAPDDEVDYSEVNIIEKVVPGQTLAKYHPAKKDIEGMTVTNIGVSGKRDEDLPPLTGVGFKQEENTYISTEKGYVSYDINTYALNVRNVYQVSGNVSYFQSVEFDGSIHVSGSVLNSAKIRANGDVIIDGFMESAHIYATQNVIIKSGVNGNGVGTIDAGGSVRAKFFENVSISAKGLIESNYFLNCNIFTDDQLIARGKKARIMGGNISAAVCVEANAIGNYLSTKAVFNIGDIYEIDKRIIAMEHSRKDITDELQQLILGRQKLSMLSGDDQASGNQLYDKISDAIHTKETQLAACNQEIARLNVVMRRAAHAYVRVHSELQADILLTISGQRKIIQKTINRPLILTKGKKV